MFLIFPLINLLIDVAFILHSIVGADLQYVRNGQGHRGCARGGWVRGGWARGDWARSSCERVCGILRFQSRQVRQSVSISLRLMETIKQLRNKNKNNK